MQNIIDVTWIFLINDPMHWGMALMSLACGIFLGFMQSSFIKSWIVGLLSCAVLAGFSGWVVYNKKSENFISMMENKEGALAAFSEGKGVYIIRHSIATDIPSESANNAKKPLTERRTMRQITINKEQLEGLHAYYTIKHPNSRWPWDTTLEVLGLKIPSKPEVKNDRTPDVVKQNSEVAPTQNAIAPEASASKVESKQEANSGAPQPSVLPPAQTDSAQSTVTPSVSN